MSWSVLEDVVSFVNNNKVSVLVLSGGELTTDPEFYEKVLYISKKCPESAMSLQSNGSFIFDSTKTKKMSELLSLNNILFTQISTHKKYYPNYEKIMNMKSEFEKLGSKVMFVSDWQGNMTNIHRLGRAVNLTDEEFKGSPGCSPILCRSNQVEKLFNGSIPTLSEFIKFLSLSGYLCKPMINEYGKLFVGECQFCVKAGDINGFKSLSTLDKNNMNKNIMMNLVNAKMCNKCNELGNLKGKVPDYVLETGSFRIK